MINKKLKVIVLVLFILMGFSSLFAGEVTFFGPEQYTRNKGKPVTIEENFTIPLNYASPGFTMTLTNGSPQGENRVSSAEIKLNGEIIFTTADFNQQVGAIEHTVELKANNLLSVKLNSKPNSYLTIHIHKFIYPPQASFSANPDTIQYQQFSSLQWAVTGADSIQIDNGIGSVGPTGSTQVSPQVPSTTYTLTAVNLGGETVKTSSVTVIFPVPTVTLQTSPIYIKPGGSSTLSWSSFAAHTVSIEPGIGSVGLNGSLPVTLSDTTTFTVTAHGYGGTQSAQATVYVDGIGPAIDVSEPTAGSFLPQKNVTLKGSIIDSSPVKFYVNENEITLGANNYFEVSLQLEENLNTIQLKSVDAAMNISTLPHQLIVDTINPAVSITFPENNAYLNSNTITITGTVNDVNPDKVILNINNTSLPGVIESDGTFRIDNVQLSTGINALSVVVIDKAGNQGQASVSCTLDQTAPVIVISSPQEGTIFNEIPITVTGTVTDENLLKVLLNNQTPVTVDTTTNTFTVENVSLVENENQLVITAEDKAGNISSQVANVIYIPDNEPPVLTVASPADNSILDKSGVTVNGTVTDKSNILYVKVNGINAAVNAQNNTYTVDLTLSEGENTVTVESEDEYNNKGSINITLTVDTIAPQVKVNSPESGSFFTNAEVVLSGEIIDATTVSLSINGQAVPPDSISGNQFNHAFTLVQGENNLTISAKDAANNGSQTSLTLFLDSTAPQITVSSPQSGSVTDKDKITITGSIEDAYPHQVTLSGGSAGQVQGELIGGSFYFRDILLSEGENAFTLVCRDRAGNSGQSDISVVRDSQPPQLTVLEPVNGAMLPGHSVLVRGTASDDGLKEVRVNNIICQLNNSEFSLLLSLVEGANMIEIRAADLAGNLKSESLQVTVDSIAPNLNITSPTADAILNTPTVIVSGRVDDIHLSGVTVKVNNQSVPLSNNEFSVDSVSLQEGKNEIVVEVGDGVGNNTGKVIPVTLDTASPSIVSVEPGDQLTGVPLSYHVSVELSEAIDETTLNSQGFYLQCKSSGENLPGTISLEGNTCIFKPSVLMPSDAEIEVHITDFIKDLAGNVLSNPQVVTFFTRDKTAPSAPQLQALPEKTALSKVIVTGTAENLAKIFITGGAVSPVQGTCDDTGSFSIEVPLKENRLNQLCVKAKDDFSNESLPTCISIYQESTEFIVTDAQLETTSNQIAANFSRAIDATTLTSTNFTVSSGAGIINGTLTVSAGNTEGIFTPEAGVDLSSQVIILEIKTGIEDQEGIRLSYPFTRVFNQEGSGNVILQGEVYDDGTGLPLSGAKVKLIRVGGSEPQSPIPTTMSTSEGKYLLLVPEGECVVRIGKENYTNSDRKIISVSGFSSAVFDSRLMPLTCEEATLMPSGGVIKSFCGGVQGGQFLQKESPLAAGGIKGIAIYPEGAIDIERKGRMTAVGAQALQGRLPVGWSPLGVFDIRVDNMDSFLKPCLLRLVNRWPEVAVSSMTLG